MNSQNKNSSKDLLQTGAGPKLGRKKNAEIGKMQQTAAADVQVTHMQILFVLHSTLGNLCKPCTIQQCTAVENGDFQTLRLSDPETFDP